MTRARWLLTVLSTVFVIAASAVLWHKLPVATNIFAPFDVHGDIGQPTAGRNLTAVVDGVTIAPTMTTRYDRKLQAIGVWLVVDGSFDVDNDPGLLHADLLVGPNRYEPADLMAYQPPQLQPGITERRGWPFDVAPTVLDGADSVVFRAWLGDGRLESRLVIDIPLDDKRVQRAPSVDLPPPAREAR